MVDARETQHVIDEPDEPVRLLRDVLAVLALLCLGKTAFGEKLGIAVENGERRFELVGYARNEVLAQIFVGAELRRHKIEVAFKLAELLHAVALRHGDVVIAPGNLARGAGELADGIRRRAGCDRDEHRDGRHRDEQKQYVLGGVAENKIAYVVALLEDDAVSHERAEGEREKRRDDHEDQQEDRQPRADAPHRITAR